MQPVSLVSLVYSGGEFREKMRGDTGGDSAHRRWSALRPTEPLTSGAHWRWLGPGRGLISVRSVIQLAGERWGKKWGKKVLHSGGFVSFDTAEDARNTA